jgi:UDP-N-acetylmuramate dehydrogenase
VADIINFLKEYGIEFEENVSGARLCSFRVGGNVKVLVKPKSVDQLTDLYAFINENDINNVLLGRGSNIVISDNGFDGVVVSLREFSKIGMDTTEDNCIVVGAGASMTSLANFAQANGLSGLEFAHGIPGSVGGGIYMNAGAYGGEISQVLESCLVFDTDSGMLCAVDGGDCDFSYRHSAFMDYKNLIILFATFELKKGNPDEIKAKMDEFKAKRVASQPLEYPSAGSTFKRPEGHFAGKLIEDAGLKGYTVGGAQVSEKHAGFVINKGGATATDIEILIDYIQKTVEEKFDVFLECEIEFME